MHFMYKNIKKIHFIFRPLFFLSLISREVTLVVESMLLAIIRLFYVSLTRPATKCGAIFDSHCRVRSSVRLHLGSSVTPTLIEGFPSNMAQMFSSKRQCTEPMLPAQNKCQNLMSNTRHRYMTLL